MARRRNGGLPADPEAAREHFLNAAESCFERYGVAKTTMDDIAKAVGVSRPTLYRHFADRDSLVFEVMMRRGRALVGRAQRFMRKHKTFEDRLVEGLLFSVNTGRRDPYVRMLVSPEHMDVAAQIIGGSPAPVELTYEMWEPILAEAVERGELRPDLDFRAIATWLTYVELVLVGRFDLLPDMDAQREMLRTFVLPAFQAPARGAPTRKAARAAKA
ncbi:MAG: TetR/AcrR family transcriptional regulator [Acidimicrobiia bacterium]